ncbi:MAG: SDR family oxidoreductase [Bacteroidota bacterium]
MNFTNKVAIITGSSRGIGKAIALELAKRGAKVVLNGRNQQRLEETLALVAAIQPESIFVCSDVSTIEGSKELIDTTINRFGQLDILINNVGISMRGNVADLNPAVFKTVFDSNVLGTVNPTILALKHLRKTKGSIVFISSLAAIHGLPGLSAYSASKAALQSVAESIRIEERNKIHVGLVFVAVTEIEHNKETIGADGKPKLITTRHGKKILSTEDVAKDVIRNIEKKKFRTIQTFLGKMNAFIHSRSPKLVEKIMIANIHKFEEGSK